MADGRATPIDFVLDLQTHRGEILWARHADGTPWTFALLTGSSSICHSLRCAIAIAEELGHERPDWELGAARLVRTSSATSPTPSPPSTAGPWTGTTRCSAGVVTGEAGRERLAAPPRRLHPRGLGHPLRVGPPVDHRRRDLRVRAWPTWRSATSESALQPVRVGPAPAHRRATATGPASCYPEEVHFPGGEQSTYTAAAVILAADALAGGSAGRRAVHRPRRLPAVLDPDRPAADRLGDEP